MNKVINTEKAPKAIGPYSQAIKAGNGMLFISGQIALNPATGELDNADLRTETLRVMQNLKAILEAAGTHFGKVIKTTIFLSDMQWFTEVNEIYATYFTDNYPARETVAVKGLPKNVHVEISMIAAVS